MERTKVELKVGIFVFIGIVILAVFILKIGNLKSYGSGYKISFIFDKTVSGVKSGSPVRFKGVDIGEVKEVNILRDEQNHNSQVEVVSWINKSLRIPKESSAFVNTLGLLGEKYIEIVPPEKYKAFLKPGEYLSGTDPVMMQDWVDEGAQIVKALEDILQRLNSGEGTIGKLLYDDRLYQELEALISDIRRNPWKLFWKTKERKR